MIFSNSILPVLKEVEYPSAVSISDREYEIVFESVNPLDFFADFWVLNEPKLDDSLLVAHNWLVSTLVVSKLNVDLVVELWTSAVVANEVTLNIRYDFSEY